MEVVSLLHNHEIKKIDCAEDLCFVDDLQEKSNALLHILQTQGWQEDGRLYKLASLLFRQVVRGKYSNLTKQELEPSVKKTKELFQQFQDKPMFAPYIVEKNDEEHHSGSQLKKYVVEGALVIDPVTLEQIPKVKYGNRDFRYDTWVMFGDDGRVVDTTISESTQEEIARIFVMDRFGQFYMHEDIPGGNGTQAIKHSSFFAGKAVAGTGKFIFDNQGALIKITNSSGHYRFGRDEMVNTLIALKRHGVNLTAVQVVFTDPATKQKTQSLASDWHI